jgi:DNA-binding FadR family transcriptional regulator
MTASDGPEGGSLSTRESLVDRAAHSILDLIVSQKLAPGAPLPSEHALAARFGVSRVVVREACRALSARGIVTIRHGRGMFVAALSPDTLSEYLAFALRQDTLLFEELLEVRFPIEVQAARLAAQRAGPPQVDRIRSALEATRAVLEDFEALARADVAFHNAIFEASGNQILALLGVGFQNLLVESRRLTYAGSVFRGETSKVALADHTRICQAIAAADVEAAGEAMREHLLMTQRALQAAHDRLRQFGNAPLTTAQMLELALLKHREADEQRHTAQEEGA